MKPAPLGYCRATSVAQACALLRKADGNARLLAGGQSLVPALNLRLIGDIDLIDINDIEEMKGIALAGDRLRLGALTRHRDLIDNPLVARHVPALAQAAPLIAHMAIRTRGTVGGSIAHADPAAELPACAVALEAEIVLHSADGERRVAAEDFFLGLFETACREDEMIVAIEFPVLPQGGRQTVMELARRSGDYALSGIVLVENGAGGHRIAYFAMGDKPVLAAAAMAVLDGGGSLDEAIEALNGDLAPIGDINGSAAYKTHISRVLLRRAMAGRGESQAA